MAHFVFTDPYLLLGTGVNLSSHITRMEMAYDADAVEDTSGGATTHVFLGGLKNWSLNVDLAQDLAASGGVDKQVFSLVGTSVAVKVRNDTTGVGATNPNYTGTGLIKSYPPIGSSIGDKATTRLEIVAASALSRATA